MCGIAGFLGEFSPRLLQAMGDMLQHRGPDDHAVHHDPATGLGMVHRRLSIIDLSANGRQPMWDSTRRVLVVYNGEIYNFPELKAELEADGFVFQSNCDTEILPNLYLRDGPDFVKRLNGIFAFALWDTRDNTLMLARDGCGVKPLYYSQTPRGLIFGSEMKVLLLSAAVDRSVDAVAMACYLSYLYCPSPGTMLRHVRKLEPGCAMIFNRSQVLRKWRFYQLPNDQLLRPISEAEAIEGLRYHLGQAVRRQMLSDVPLGAFLSGGLDSSSIVAFARQFAKNGTLDCFTIGLGDATSRDDGATQDYPYAVRMAEHLGVPLHTIEVGPEMARSLERMVYHLDEPQADPAALNVLYISSAARKLGIKVLLSGAGGDDILAGYRRHHAIALEKVWRWLPRAVRTGMRLSTDTLRKDSDFGRRVSKAFAYADEDLQGRLIGYFLWTHPEETRALLHPDISADLTARKITSPMASALEGLARTTPPLNQMLFLDGKFFLTDHNLNYTDKMSMAAGVEVRVPFLDPDLMNFAARLPLDFKQHGATGKWLLKRTMEGILPHASIYRPKVGFGVPLERWLKTDLRELVNDTLSESVLSRRGLFSPSGVASLLRRERAGRVYAAYPIFGIMCIEVWCQTFLDRFAPID